MALSDKFIIIPIDKYNRLRTGAEKAEQITHTPSDNGDKKAIESNKESEMDAIPVNREDSYQVHKDSLDPGHDDPLLASRLNTEVIISSIPKMYRGKIEALLKYLGNALHWTDGGEVIINGETIPNSHIIDLLRDSQRTYANFTPAGRGIFWELMRKAKVPKSLIGNENFSQRTADTKVPKPKRVVKKRPSLRKNKMKWINL